MKSLIVVSLLLFLASCSGETVTTRSVKNNSDKNLKMIVYNNGNASDTLLINKGQSFQLSVTTSNQGTDAKPDCVWEIDSALTIVEGGGVMTKKIQKSDNWDSETEQVKNIPPNYENSCTFNIYDYNIE